MRAWRRWLAGGLVIGAAALAFPRAIAEAIEQEEKPSGDPQKTPGGAETETPARLPVETERLGPSLAVIRIAGISSTVLSGPDGVLVVDPGLEQAGPLLEEEIRRLGWGPIRTIVDTHWHFDHAGGNKTAGRAATILASAATREWLSEDQQLLGELQPAYPVEALPRAVEERGQALSGFAERVTLRPAPGGHTGGDLLVHFEESGVLAIGDIVFAGQFPFVDVDHGGSAVTLADVLQDLVDGYPESTRFLPGHGPLLSRDDLMAYRRMIVETTQAVRGAMERGKSVQEMQGDAILAKWKEWDGSFTQKDWIAMVHASLAKEVSRR